MEGEQKAAKRIGQDITKYVQDMKQLEQQVQCHVNEKSLLKEKLGMNSFYCKSRKIDAILILLSGLHAPL